MFADAIDEVSQFTRPIHFVSRNFGSDRPIAGAATLFFINADGWAFTCAHVAAQITAAQAIGEKYANFRAQLAAGRGKMKERELRKGLSREFGYTSETCVELLVNFVNCIDGDLELHIITSNLADVALIRFSGAKLQCDKFPAFWAGPLVRQGEFLCRLGFPFAEFTNFAFDASADRITWTNEGRTDTPRFPIEGMVTRHLADSQRLFGFELSTPGIRGQSGGPAFDSRGIIRGMQFGTNHLDLDFDVNQEVLRNGIPKRVKDSAFLHVGHCVDVEILKSVMREHNVRFAEAA